MLPNLSIGPITLPLPGLLLIVGMWFGITLAERYSLRHSVDAGKLYNLVIVVLVFGFVGARLGFIALNPASYIARPLDILALNLTASDLWSGMAIGIVAGLIFMNKNQLALLPILDALTPLFAVLMFAHHLANLASGAAFGSETDLPWAIHLWGTQRHPVQFYEALGAGVILFVLWRKGFHNGQAPGNIFLVFVGMSAGARLYFEAFRGDSILIGNLRAVQIAAWILLTAVIFSLTRQKSNDQGAKSA